MGEKVIIMNEKWMLDPKCRLLLVIQNPKHLQQRCDAKFHKHNLFP
jgi:hypothetical protein